ncbi:MAG: hypothetical protein AVDCRST_MAG01-01-603, partial [uncultured Rubrobacteraceae bacterium]
GSFRSLAAVVRRPGHGSARGRPGGEGAGLGPVLEGHRPGAANVGW